jgi:hypothetical protein
MTQTKPKERGIIMTADSVRGILAGRKTQTRRIIKPQPDWLQPEECCAVIEPEGWQGTGHSGLWSEGGDPETEVRRCPFGMPGDRLWVREAWGTNATHDKIAPRDLPEWAQFAYAASVNMAGIKVRSPLHMPRRASRLTLELTNVRVERVQDISEDDAKAEGIKITTYAIGPHFGAESGKMTDRTASAAYAQVWNALHGPDAWKRNDWVFVLDFKKVEL